MAAIQSFPSCRGFIFSLRTGEHAGVGRGQIARHQGQLHACVPVGVLVRLICRVGLVGWISGGCPSSPPPPLSHASSRSPPHTPPSIHKHEWTTKIHICTWQGLHAPHFEHVDVRVPTADQHQVLRHGHVKPGICVCVCGGGSRGWIDRWMDGWIDVNRIGEWCMGIWMWTYRGIIVAQLMGVRRGLFSSCGMCAKWEMSSGYT